VAGLAVDDLAQVAGEVAGAQLEHAAALLQLRHGEHVLDEAAEAHALSHEVVVDRGDAGGRDEALLQQLGVHAQGGQRGPQLVRDGGHEGGLLGGQLVGAAGRAGDGDDADADDEDQAEQGTCLKGQAARRRGGGGEAQGDAGELLADRVGVGAGARGGDDERAAGGGVALGDGGQPGVDEEVAVEQHALDRAGVGVRDDALEDQLIAEREVGHRRVVDLGRRLGAGGGR
jgi:hypothetical protein